MGVDARGPATQPVSGTVAATIADGASVALGTTTDAATTTSSTGTVIAKLRGLVAILADVWVSANQVLRSAVMLNGPSSSLGGTTTVAADGEANTQATLQYTGIGGLRHYVRGLLYNASGSTWDLFRSGSATNVGATSGQGSALVHHPGDWSVQHTPAANTQATIAKAAGAAGVRHVCTSISASIANNALLGAAVNATVNLRDGASGAGTILWSQQLALQVTAGQQDALLISGLNIVGSAATAMTLEFAAAGGANTLEVVAMTGHEVS